MEFAPNVHRIDGVVGSNAVLLAGEQMAVVDTGIPGNGERIVEYIRSIGRSPGDLRWIVLTHHHFDHSGSAAELHALTGAQIAAHAHEAEPTPDGSLLLYKGTEGQHIPLWYRWVVGANRRPAAQRPAFPDTPVHLALNDGDALPGLDAEVLHTPGHTPGSICLLLKGPQVLFLGDSAINNRDRISRPLMWDRGRRRQLDASLRRLREVEAEIAAFGHGPHLEREVIERLRSLTDRPYDLPTWRIVLKNWRTLRRFHQSTRRSGHWEGGGAAGQGGQPA
jgi:glyoxylase-like metal-dependent hydrolase (beta-lactamase superfamily II)